MQIDGDALSGVVPGYDFERARHRVEIPIASAGEIKLRVSILNKCFDQVGSGPLFDKLLVCKQSPTEEEREGNPKSR